MPVSCIESPKIVNKNIDKSMDFFKSGISDKALSKRESELSSSMISNFQAFSENQTKRSHIGHTARTH